MPNDLNADIPRPYRVDVFDHRTRLSYNNVSDAFAAFKVFCAKDFLVNMYNSDLGYWSVEISD